MGQRARLVAAAGLIIAIAGGATLAIFLARQGLGRASLWATVLGFPAVVAGIVMQVWPLVSAGRARQARPEPDSARSPPLAGHAADDPDAPGHGHRDAVGTYGEVLAGENVPAELLDRDEELDALAAFCAEPGDYLWLQAPPWAGKTALASWFALHPPPGIRVVPFYVNSRMADGANSEAFLRAMISQLAAIAVLSSQDPDPGMDGRAHFIYLLQVAADKLVQAGDQLVLLVDGLDEDQGSRPSIAYCLPRHLPAGVRVIVSSRRSRPDVPGDVPSDHPLRWCTRIELAPSAHAAHVQHEAEHELQIQLADPGSARLLGFITASGGGLSARDLAELSGRPAWEVENQLAGTLGRSLEVLTRSGEQLYVLGHAALQETAETRLDIAAYRAGIHHLYDQYEKAGWPDHTPSYLLRPYTAMVARNGPASRLSSVVKDQARHELMARRTGADTEALGEIFFVWQFLAQRPDLDLRALVEVAVERARISQRNTAIPAALPEVLARIGDADRAEALAQAITSDGRRAEALGLVARCLIHADPQRAERIATTIPDPYVQARTLAAIAEGMAPADPDRARRIAAALPGCWKAKALSACAAALAGTDPEKARDLGLLVPAIQERAHAIAAVAAVVARTDPDQAMHIAAALGDPHWQAEAAAEIAQEAARTDPDRAERIAAGIPDSYWRARALFALAGTLAATRPGRTARLAGTAEKTAAQIPFPYLQAEVLAEAASALAPHLPGTASRLIAAIPLPHMRSRSQAALAGAMARSDPSGARRVTATIADPYWRAEALATIAEQGPRGQAAGLAAEAEQLASSLPDDHQRTAALTVIAKLTASHNPESALKTAAAIANGAHRATAVAGIAGIIAASDPDRAEQMIGGPHDTQGLIAASVALALAGTDPGRAERIAGRITGRARRAQALAELALALTAGHPGHAARIADISARTAVIPTAGPMDPADLAHAARALADSHPTQAVQLAMKAARIAATTPEFTGPAPILSDLASALAATSPEQAEQLAATIPGGREHDHVLASIITAAASADPARAERLTAKITDAEHLAAALAAVAAATTDPDRAAELAGQAAQTAQSIPDAARREQALARTAVTLARSDPDRAVRIAASITDDHRCAGTLTAVATTVAGSDPERAAGIVTAIADSKQQSQALAEITATVAATGPELAEQIASDITDTYWQAAALAQITANIAYSDPQHAQQVLRKCSNPIYYAESLANLAAQAAATDPATAASIAREAGRAGADYADYLQEPQALIAIACYLAATDERRAHDLTDRAVRLAATMPDRKQGIRTISAATLIAECAEPSRTEALAETLRRMTAGLPAGQEFTGILSEFTRALAGMDRQAAEQVADGIPDASARAISLGAIAARIAERDPGSSKQLAEKARRIAAGISQPSLQVSTLLRVADQASQSGNAGLIPCRAALADILSGECWAQSFTLLAIVDPAAATAGAAALLAPVSDP